MLELIIELFAGLCIIIFIVIFIKGLIKIGSPDHDFSGELIKEKESHQQVFKNIFINDFISEIKSIIKDIFYRKN